MQTETIFRALLASIVILGASSFTGKQITIPAETSLKVKVSEVKSAEGNVHILLFNQAAGFPTNPAMAYKHVKCKAASGEVIITIDKIPAGTYSIVAFHDKNVNEEFDKSWFGSPKEDYGFSNIPDEYCGTPSFQQTSFVVNQTASTISVKLISIQ